MTSSNAFSVHVLSVRQRERERFGDEEWKIEGELVVKKRRGTLKDGG